MSSWNNRITIIGNVGKDPEQFDAGGNTIVKFSVACKRGKEKTDWLPVSCWHDLARGVLATIKKGDQVIISGSMQIDTKKKDDGTYATYTNLNADYVGLAVRGIEKEDNGEAEETAPF